MPVKNANLANSKDHSPFSFGIFKAVFDFRKSLQTESTCPDHAKEQVHEALNFLIAGYFEFSKPAKAEFYRKARVSIAQLWLTLQIATTETPGELPTDHDYPSHPLERYSAQILSELLPGISGTLRKIENGKPYGNRKHPSKDENADPATPAIGGDGNGE